MDWTLSVSRSDVGELIGTKSVLGVNRFLGIPYATIQNRFASPGRCRVHFPPAQAGLRPELDKGVRSRPPCLNITALKSIQGDQKLPVLAITHSGGFRIGSPLVPQYYISTLICGICIIGRLKTHDTVVVAEPLSLFLRLLLTTATGVTFVTDTPALLVSTLVLCNIWCRRELRLRTNALALVVKQERHGNEQSRQAAEESHSPVDANAYRSR